MAERPSSPCWQDWPAVHPVTACGLHVASEQRLAPGARWCLTRHLRVSIDRTRDFRSQKAAWQFLKSMVRSEKGARLTNFFHEDSEHLQRYVARAEVVFVDAMLGRPRREVALETQFSPCVCGRHVYGSRVVLGPELWALRFEKDFEKVRASGIATGQTTAPSSISRTSLSWEAPEYRALMHLPHVFDVHLLHCQFGSLSRRRSSQFGATAKEVSVKSWTLHVLGRHHASLDPVRTTHHFFCTGALDAMFHGFWDSVIFSTLNFACASANFNRDASGNHTLTYDTAT